MNPSIPERSPIEKIVQKVKRQGAMNTAHAVLMKAINAVVPFKILRGVSVEEPDPGYLEVPATYDARFLPDNALRAFAADAATEMSAAFVEATLAKGDECYAICDGANLAAYGWYATTPTTAGSPELLLHFDADYVYMYKVFTDPRYRGQRLHAVGMTRALDEYRCRGYRGMVSYVESTNFDSLKSCFRMGYKVFGSIYVVKLFGRYFAFSSPGCAPFGFRLEVERDRRVDSVIGKNPS
jgi:GNAT superfamily N-acetyltransferase